MNDRSDERGKRGENLQQICEEEHMERKDVRCGKKKKKGMEKEVERKGSGEEKRPKENEMK